MRRSLSDALRDRPLLFEPVPPTGRTSPEKVESYVTRIVSLLDIHSRVDAIVIPELVSENHNGQPHYRSGDVRAFAAEVSKRAGCEVIVNKVVAHVRSIADLEAWCQGAIEADIRNVVFVGGSSRYIPYEGPSVAAANAGLLPLVRKHRGRIGNVVIPQREHEGYRMLTKTRAGASFFTTQIVFDPEPIASLLDEYARLCAAYDVAPASVMLSFAPIADEDDVDYVRWLGAEVPERLERGLISEDGSGSIAAAVRTWHAVAEERGRHAAAVPLGANIEVVTPRRFSLAVELLGRIERELGNGSGGRA